MGCQDWIACNVKTRSFFLETEAIIFLAESHLTFKMKRFCLARSWGTVWHLRTHWPLICFGLGMENCLGDVALRKVSWFTLVLISRLVGLLRTFKWPKNSSCKYRSSEQCPCHTQRPHFWLEWYNSLPEIPFGQSHHQTWIFVTPQRLIF